MCEAAECDVEYETKGDIRPSGLDEFRSFLAEQADAAAYELAYTDDEGDHQRLVAKLRVIERTVERPAAAIAVACTALTPDEDDWTVRLDSIDRVTALELPSDEALTGEPTPKYDNAGAFLNLARVAPERIDVPDLVAFLRGADDDGRDAGLGALRSALRADPESAEVAIPLLRDLLAEEHNVTRVLEILATVTGERPAEVAPFVEELRPYLGDDGERRAYAAECLSDIAAHDPSDVMAAVPALASLVDDRDDGVTHALFALNRIAAEHPSEVLPAAPTLSDALAEPSLSSSDRLNATAALGRVASEYPDAGLDTVDDLVELLDCDDPRLRVNATGVLSDVAVVHSGALVPHVDELESLLYSDDEYTLINTSAGLGRIAEVEPEAVEHFTDRFVELLDHDQEVVRENACWALGYLEAESALERLEAVRLDDEAERVRNIAAWAIAEIEGWA
ncbi:HEAT repeat domain-containing protein [Natronomonas salina]|uniref:HEAT repeat domain-containing protein n=1 Tax=Natronomonas salina TaxID=1710540 RepID=UPI0015B5AFC3|nr:HEAT repeat domain-containing protein [Natronomonas salina]QLD89070.1 HEAT repeat domain-containing protein [Natronomonas salina]